MFAHSKFVCSALLEYLPVRFQGTQQQVDDRKEVFNFKDGHPSVRIKNLLVGKINEITGKDKSSWLICFIPSSTREKTQIRYGALSNFLTEKTGVATSLVAITNKVDRESMHTGTRMNNPASTFTFNEKEFSGKKILLIDDVITQGNTFSVCASVMSAKGAAMVQGLFVARTVHPERNSRFRLLACLF